MGRPASAMSAPKSRVCSNAGRSSSNTGPRRSRAWACPTNDPLPVTQIWIQKAATSSSAPAAAASAIDLYAQQCAARQQLAWHVLLHYLPACLFFSHLSSERGRPPAPLLQYPCPRCFDVIDPCPHVQPSPKGSRSRCAG